jgi:hypothetical protein
MISLRSLCAGRTEKEGDTNDREHAAEAAALGHRCSICEVTPRNVALQRWRRQQTDRPTMRVTPAALWWHTAVVYQIYPQSFQASDRDGIDGLRGIQRRLDHIVELVAKRSGRRRYSLVRWPISGMTFLITPRSTRYSHARPIRRAAHRASRGYVPNHTSNQHPGSKRAVHRATTASEIGTSGAILRPMAGSKGNTVRP